jgi:hypothetical protein
MMDYVREPAYLESGRQDLNLRPPAPHAGALAKLRHAPFVNDYFSIRWIIKQIFLKKKLVLAQPGHPGLLYR